MNLWEVEYDSNNGYSVVYACRSCGRKIQDNRFEFCPHCGVKLLKDGKPELLRLDEGDICGLIAFAITNGGFKESGLNYMRDGKHYKVEGPGRMGMVWAAWKKEKMEERKEEREAIQKEVKPICG